MGGVLGAQFATLPTLPTPADLWQRAIVLGQACREVGRVVQRFDLLVAAVALHHNAVRVSFDADFEAIASVSELRLKGLRRPV
jgi:predicted nucleic acid-binding protein